MKDLGADNKTILNLFLKNLNGNLGTEFIWKEINIFCILFWKHKQNMGFSLKCRELFSSLVTNYSSDQIKKEMGGACSAYGRYQKCMQDFSGETWKKETTWKTQA